MGADQEIKIYLSTTSPLEPIYVSHFQSSDNSLGSDYLAQLESVLCFDFNHNSITKAVYLKDQNEKSLRHPLIKGEVKNKALTLAVISWQDGNKGSSKKFPEVTLSGNIGTDRRTIHRLADAILKSIYGYEGVAATKILYSVKHKVQNKWISEIWSCDWDGANAKQITHDKSLSVTPVFMPYSPQYSNNNFLYVSDKSGQLKVYIASLNDGVGKKFLDIRKNQLLPAVSPQRDKIAFISDAAGAADLFLQEFNPKTGEVGKPVQLFSYPNSAQATPTFSPDGSKLAFVSDKDGAPRIYLIPATFNKKRAEPVLITRQNSENSCPAWSPDGKKLAYSAKTKGTRQIWIYDFESREEWQLTDGTENKENPSWAPDSKHLVFNSTDGHVSELYIVNLNQPDVVKISQGSGVKHYPTWGKN